ncbi:hypothetical protein A6V39_03870 [Candidatus Mycoplasma haematobovis]|uniref:Uncharacterized protein n=1 Tax=Candidatus Mycoplasma haematobovis TaxID=432608 RepID=A0A1A9QDJ8_9MOLU|nr:hypothetical protein [Candidatus Mycoplasma haematobovis]OAL10025.1 hypothetical protein A6V39_03870 [Candidatus Mycoplasma haematobovis]
MSLASKIVAGIATTGAVGGVLALGSYSLINTQNIQGRLKEEGYVPLDTEKDTGWNTILIAYKVAKSNTFVTGPQLQQQEIKDLRDKCREALRQSSNNNENYLKARQWCVEERNISSILDKLGLRALQTEPKSGSSTNTDDQNWETKATEYRDSTSKHKITITPVNQEPVDKEKIKAACKTLNTTELKTTSDGFNDKLEQFKEWCAIKKDSNG